MKIAIWSVSTSPAASQAAGSTRTQGCEGCVAVGTSVVTSMATSHRFSNPIVLALLELSEVDPLHEANARTAAPADNVTLQTDGRCCTGAHDARSCSDGQQRRGAVRPRPPTCRAVQLNRPLRQLGRSHVALVAIARSHNVAVYRLFSSEVR